jgi:hypothetical protein
VTPYLGVQMLVETVDSPGFSAPTVTPADGASQMTQIYLNQSFSDFLTLWANSTGSNAQAPVNAVSAPNGYGTSGSWADHVYGVLLQQAWSVSVTANVPGGQTVGQPAITLGQATTYDPLKPPGSTPVVLAPPSLLAVWAKNARN